jgi:hypothetical protein
MPLDIEKRVSCSLLIGNYLRAVKRFEEASKEFNAVCQACHKELPEQSRFITQHDFRWYLVTTTDSDSSFEVDEIETL